MGAVRTWWRWLGAWAAGLCLGVVAGCGPGVGGTGTGMEQPPGTPAPTAPTALAALCASELSPLLRCPAASSAGAALGTALVWLADGDVQRDALARVEGNAVDLDLACSGLQFSGTWGQVAGQAPRFHGVVRGTAGGDIVPASLAAQRLDTRVVLQLFDAQERALTAPLVVQAAAGALPARACP